MAVVKGNAYGHGIEPCVQAMDDLCDWYGTATMQEALRVRSVSGEKPILVFGYVSDEEIRLAAENNITLSAFFATVGVSHISECCAGMNLKAAVHLKLDTGFHRMGIDCCSSTADCVEQLLSLFSLPNIEITGMYTHLVYGAGAAIKGSWRLPNCSISAFKAASGRCRNEQESIRASVIYATVRQRYMLQICIWTWCVSVPISLVLPQPRSSA